jgi:hypothetical protein
MCVGFYIIVFWGLDYGLRRASRCFVLFRLISLPFAWKNAKKIVDAISRGLFCVQVQMSECEHSPGACKTAPGTVPRDQRW